MKCKLFVLYLFLLANFANAQAPQSFSYQAVVRDAQGNILPNQNVAFRFSIIENNTNGTIVYQETQQATTNTLGLVVLAIGNGTVQQGVFSTIQWGSTPHFLKVELDVAGGANFVDMGTTQLLSVPYALHAETAGNVQTYTAGNGISITGNVIENTAPNQPVTILGQGATSVTGTYPNFTVSSTDNVNDADADPNNELQTLNINGNQLSISSGNTVNLPTYSLIAGDGVEINGNTINTVWTKNGDNIYNNNTGKVGIGLTAPTGKVTIQGDTSNVLFEVRDKNGIPVFVVYQDSVNVFVSNTSAKTNKGTFAVNGKTQSKAGFHSIFRVVPDSIVEIKDANGLPIFKAFQDSVQVFVDNSGAKTNKGTFAVNGKTQSKAGERNYLRISPDSSRLYTEDPNGGFGVRDYSSGTTTSYMQLTPENYFIGHQAGADIINGIYNNVMGYYAGSSLTNGSNNSIMGYNAGKNLTVGSSNIIIGYEAAKNATTMVYNTIMGYSAGFNLTSSQQNVLIGYETGYSTTYGSLNTAIGSFALHNNIIGSSNVAIGNNALYSNTDGIGNTATGSEVLYSNTSGSYNTANGLKSLYENITGNNNSAFGYNSMYHNTTGSDNTSLGSSSLAGNLTGINNTSVGSYALSQNTTGNYNVAIGAFSLPANNASYNTAIGCYSLYVNTTGSWNTALGGGCLRNNTTGSDNVAAGYSTMQENIEGSSNCAFGNYAMLLNTNGNYNVAFGTSSLFSNTTGSENTAIGTASMEFNNAGGKNTAVGMNSLFNNTSGNFNISIGHSSLYNNASGNNNIAIGYQSLYNNSSSGNVAIGSSSARNNTSGYNNTAIGNSAMYNNTTGVSNTAVGNMGLYSNQAGINNTALGESALFQSTSNDNTAVGYYALFRITTGQQNSALGKDAGPGSGFGNLWCTTALGYGAQPTADYSARIGNAWLTSIGGYTSWTNFSDKRFKNDIQENVPGLEFILKLKPVTYHLNIAMINKSLGQEYNQDDAIRSGKENIVYTGFLAQDVEQAAKEIGFDFSGVDKPKNENGFYGLRYAEFTVPLVKAVQELHLKNIELQQTIDNQNIKIFDLQKQFDELKNLINK